VVGTVAAPPSTVVKCARGGGVLRVVCGVVCGVVLVVSLLWCCSGRVLCRVVLVVCLCV